MKQYIFFTAILLSALSCDREDAKNDGRYVSCKINGKSFTNKFIDLYGVRTNGLSIVHNPDYGNYLRISAYNQDSKYQLDIFVKECKTGTFELIDNNGKDMNELGSQAMLTSNSNSKYYLSKAHISGHVTITTATTTDCKGTFEFKLYNYEDPNDVITVTNGKFDD